jgi:hypothetical protein
MQRRALHRAGHYLGQIIMQGRQLGGHQRVSQIIVVQDGGIV